MRQVHYLIALALSAGALTASAMGCELVSAVDRSSISDGGSGGGTGGTGGDATTTTGGGMGGAGGAGGGCAPNCMQGDACSAPGDCTSGFCANSVCCDTACDGTCEACSAALKQSGMTDGECGQAAAGTSCGAGQTCAAGNETSAFLCDDTGTCIDGVTTSCGNYNCDAAGMSCLTACTVHADCNSTSYCEGTACEPKKTPGATCTVTEECATGFCVDGVCCDTACGAACQACNVAASLGTCTSTPVGSTDAMCMGTMACDGAGMCKAANGETCAMAGDCASGNCVDGVCCNTICTGNCRSCNLTGTEGTCSNVMQGTVEAMCVAPANVCNNMGMCKLGGNATCTMNSECASGVCTITMVTGFCTNP